MITVKFDKGRLGFKDLLDIVPRSGENLTKDVPEGSVCVNQQDVFRTLSNRWTRQVESFPQLLLLSSRSLASAEEAVQLTVYTHDTAPCNLQDPRRHFPELRE